jgi:hypothetical protein
MVEKSQLATSQFPDEVIRFFSVCYLGLQTWLILQTKCLFHDYILQYTGCPYYL